MALTIKEKTITTGEGGMVVVNNQALFQKIAILKNQGNSLERVYWHEVAGYNYRMTNLSAAIGLAQLEQAEEILAKKRRIAELYKQNLKALPLRLQQETVDCQHSFWMISLLVEDKENRDALREFLALNGIETRPFFHPIHHLPMYKHLPSGESCTVAEDISSKGINLPSYPGLTSSEVEFICEQIHIFYAQDKSSCSVAADTSEVLQISS